MVSTKNDTPGDTNIDEVLGEYMVRLDRGEQIDREQLTAEHPSIARQLRDYFEAETAMRAFCGHSQAPSRRSSSPCSAWALPDGITESVRSSISRLIADEVLSLQEAVEFFAELAPTAYPEDAASVASALLSTGRLTAYQAEAVSGEDLRRITLGPYTILDRIGEGGMSVVFRARHRQMNRMVALKQLHQHSIRSEDHRRRFQREARAVAALSHPNIVTAYDADEIDGIHYLAMEYVEGSDLGTLVSQTGPLPLDQTIRIVLQIAEGLRHAHERGVIHRDLKPSNVLMDRHGNVRITDFGVARLTSLADDHEGEHTLTTTGQLLGTVGFAAPEQLRDGRSADHRSDIYSLGCTMYFLLTGSPLFAGCSLRQILNAHRKRLVPQLRTKRADVSRELEQAFCRMVAMRSEDRYQTMDHLIRELQNAHPVDGPVTATSASPTSVQDDTCRGSVSTREGTATAGERATPSRRIIWAILACAITAAAAAIWFFGFSSLGSRAGATTVDLLPLIDPSRDSIYGEWRREGACLISPKERNKVRIEVPYVPPEEYRLRAVVSREEGDNAILIGLVAEGHQFTVLLDFQESWIDGPATALENVDGLNVLQNKDTLYERVLKTAGDSEIVCTVYRDRVTVEIDGTTIIDWHGEMSRLLRHEYWQVPHEDVLYLATYDCSYRIHKLEVTPISGEGRFPEWSRR